MYVFLDVYDAVDGFMRQTSYRSGALLLHNNDK